MFCPQCGTQVGEGAKACAACGWTASRRTLWIVLGCICGFVFLVCCGAGTWFFMRARRAVEAMQGDIVPLQLAVSRAQVVNYTRIHGKPPATLEEASSEALVSEKGEKVRIQFQNNQKAADMWGTAFRFTLNADRSFEVRSAGPDGKFDGADDIVEKGRLDDDLAALQKELEARSMRMGEGFIREFGIDPEKLREKNKGNLEGRPAVGTGGK